MRRDGSTLNALFLRPGLEQTVAVQAGRFATVAHAGSEA
jgi:hypothetical protein